VPASFIARWIESSIIVFPPPTWHAMGPGFNNVVTAIERFDDQTHAAGAFSSSGATAVNHIARWNEVSEAWEPLGSGLNSNVFALRTGAPGIQTIELLVGGAFTTAGGVSASRIARWTVNTVTHAETWSPMGAGLSGDVYAIERHNNQTYAGGAFTASGATTVNRLARWTGAAWVAVGNGGAGGGFNGPVRAIKSVGPHLYVAGDFTSVDGIKAAWMIACSPLRCFTMRCTPAAGSRAFAAARCIRRAGASTT
jgi:hypothetical protein